MQCLESMLSSIEILILAAIQGISEFLPVSSVAHLVLVSKYYAFNNQNLLIDICLHLGSLIAIIFYFRKDLFNFFQNKTFLIKIFISTIPIIPVGYILYQTGLINHLRSLEIIGWTSLIFGLLLYVRDKAKITKKIDTEILSKMSFQNVNTKRFPSIKLISRCLNFGLLTPTIVNASNEVLISLFLKGKIGFLDIVKTINRIFKDKEFNKYAKRKPRSIEDIRIADNWARLKTINMCV